MDVVLIALSKFELLKFICILFYGSNIKMCDILMWQNIQHKSNDAVCNMYYIIM